MLEKNDVISEFDDMHVISEEESDDHSEDEDDAGSDDEDAGSEDEDISENEDSISVDSEEEVENKSKRKKLQLKDAQEGLHILNYCLHQ